MRWEDGNFLVRLQCYGLDGVMMGHDYNFQCVSLAREAFSLMITSLLTYLDQITFIVSRDEFNGVRDGPLVRRVHTGDRRMLYSKQREYFRSLVIKPEIP